MSEGKENRPRQESESKIEVVGSLELAEKLLREQGDLKGNDTWMGIGVNKKTYPDEMVLDFARWASKSSDNFLLVVADFVQKYNLVASTGNWDNLYEGKKARKMDREGEKRADEITSLVKGAKLENVQVVGWVDLMKGIEKENEKNNLMVNYGFQQFDYRYQHDVKFREALQGVVKKQIPHVLKDLEARGRNPQMTLDASAMYAMEEIFASWLLVETKKYPIKIGHEGEKLYDEITASLFEDETKFGSVYLRR